MAFDSTDSRFHYWPGEDLPEDSLDGCYLVASADLEDGSRIVLYVDRANVSTARIVNTELTDVHRHAHRDAAVDDFRARAGLLKENRNAR